MDIEKVNPEHLVLFKEAIRAIFLEARDGCLDEGFRYHPLMMFIEAGLNRGTDNFAESLISRGYDFDLIGSRDFMLHIEVSPDGLLSADVYGSCLRQFPKTVESIRQHFRMRGLLK